MKWGPVMRLDKLQEDLLKYQDIVDNIKREIELYETDEHHAAKVQVNHWEDVGSFSGVCEYVRSLVRTISELKEEVEFERELKKKYREIATIPEEEVPVSKSETANAFNVLQKSLQEDSSYAWGWHSNVAVAFQDEGGEFIQSNIAAARFMKLAFGIDMTESDEWRNIIGIQTELAGKK